MDDDKALVIWRVDGRVGHIVLNRPQAANAIDSALSVAFVDAVAQASRADIGAVVISARGKQFCAGGDINEFIAHSVELAALIAPLLERLLPAIHALATLPVPVISAVQGPIGGAGIALALCADLVLAVPEMKLRGGYSAIGLSPDLGASYYLARRAGAARAKQILFTNRAIPAEECLRWGLVDELHPAERLMPVACELAAQLAHGATQALGGIKRLCDSAYDHDLRTHLDLERDALLACARSAESREGIAAFIEKRPPVFAKPVG